mmetsp:Transcript_1077/g.1989  ORF Transcript_1077/g.1989 Transcript_1077/m.1989 type:complete len:92 (+) Transcript_1077:1085-1360(+)
MQYQQHSSIKQNNYMGEGPNNHYDEQEEEEEDPGYEMDNAYRKDKFSPLRRDNSPSNKKPSHPSHQPSYHNQHFNQHRPKSGKKGVSFAQN